MRAEHPFARARLEIQVEVALEALPVPPPPGRPGPLDDLEAHEAAVDLVLEAFPGTIIVEDRKHGECAA